jgi:hypothetical protein
MLPTFERSVNVLSMGLSRDEAVRVDDHLETSIIGRGQSGITVSATFIQGLEL